MDDPRSSPARLEADLVWTRGELARTGAERDALLHQLIKSNSTTLGRLGWRWTSYKSRHRWAERFISRPSTLLGMVVTLRWPGGIRVNPLFDEAWYRTQYPDAPSGRRAAYRQYRRLSLEEGRDPNALFDTDWYLERNPDVRSGFWHPLDHYLFFGWREGRNPGPDFDGFDYLRQHPDAALAATNPLLHRMRAGPFRPGDPAAPQLPGPPPIIRRTVNHYRRHGLRKTVARVIGELRAGGAARSAATALVPPVATEMAAGAITAHLDTPRAGSIEGSSTLQVAGWAFSQGGNVSVSVYIDTENMAECVVGLPRPDVGSLYSSHRGAASSGFAARVPLAGVETGQRVLQVVLRDERGSVRVLMCPFRRVTPEAIYHDYYERALPTDAEIAELRSTARGTDPPDVHLVVIAENVPDLDSTLRSIAIQDYPSLSCCIVLGDDDDQLTPVLDAVTDLDTRVTSGLAAALPAEPDPNRLVGFLQAGETLAPAALLRMALQDAVADPQVIYSDHDSVDDTGRHARPWFVPDRSPDHLLSQDYIGGFYLIRDDAELRGWLPESIETAGAGWRYALSLERIGARERVAHVSHVLWSRPLRDATHATADAELATVQAALDRQGVGATARTVHISPDGGIRAITWPLAEPPLVSVIIPTTGRLELVTEIVTSLTDRTDYPDLEIIFVDNSRGKHPEGIDFLRRQDVTVLERDEPFNWAKLNNDGARAARGRLLLFLNDDMEARDQDWLTVLVRQAMRPGVGAVGPLLTFPDGTIQHAGVVLVGYGGGAAHLFSGMDASDELYLDLHLVTREVTSLTGACLLVPRTVFDQLGGFDEDLAIVGNDVDFCLRVARTGRRVLFEPNSRLIHHESQSRSGVDYAIDEIRVWERWSDVLERGDPHYNVNLSSDRVDASLAWDRVADRAIHVGRTAPADGVNLVGYVRAEMGLGEALRGEARALSEVGIPFVLLDVNSGTPARRGDRSWAHKIVDDPIFATNLIHINADRLPWALPHLPQGLLRGRRNIGYWTWELPEFPREWNDSFSFVDEVWVPSEYVRAAIDEAAPVPVHVLPHVVRMPSGPFVGRSHFGLPAGPVQFLAMYDVHSISERKNPKGVIEAFRQAFGPEDDVLLVVKVNTATEDELSSIHQVIGAHPLIRVLSTALSRHETDSLMAASDVFVSLHRAEGFGLPIAEAMSLGKPVVATGWSGNMDFMSEETAACVRYEIVELERTYGPYEAGQHWAEPDLEDAAGWMGRLATDAELRERLGAAGQRVVADRFAPSAVGARMADLLGAGAVAQRRSGQDGIE